MNVENLKARVDALLARAAKQPTGSDAITAATELLQGTITIMHTIYGPNSAQEETLRSVTADRPTAKPLPLPLQMAWVVDAVRGALLNIKAELDGDLLGNLQKRVTGDVLSDFIRLARHVIEEQREGGKDVAAVLVAVAYEDTIRRMGGRPHQAGRRRRPRGRHRRAEEGWHPHAPAARRRARISQLPQPRAT